MKRYIKPELIIVGIDVNDLLAGSPLPETVNKEVPPGVDNQFAKELNSIWGMDDETFDE